MKHITQADWCEQLSRMDGMDRKINDDEFILILQRFFEEKSLKLLTAVIDAWKRDNRMYPTVGELMSIARDLMTMDRHIGATKPESCGRCHNGLIPVPGGGHARCNCDKGLTRSKRIGRFYDEIFPDEDPMTYDEYLIRQFESEGRTEQPWAIVTEMV